MGESDGKTVVGVCLLIGTKGSYSKQKDGRSLGKTTGCLGRQHRGEETRPQRRETRWNECRAGRQLKLTVPRIVVPDQSLVDCLQMS